MEWEPPGFRNGVGAVLDSEGQPKVQSVTCVYCLWGNIARLKPVTVLWQEDEYILEEVIKWKKNWRYLIKQRPSPWHGWRCPRSYSSPRYRSG